jgi:two-component system, cell cycle sensor histidine kinase and response regulator CckA
MTEAKSEETARLFDESVPQERPGCLHVVPGTTALGVSQDFRNRARQIERRDWWLWSCAIAITLLLTTAVISFAILVLHLGVSAFNFAPLGDTILGLVGLVLLFDIYVLYQHFQIQVMRKHLLVRDELFRLITENAADMIAVVDVKGRRLYNSPSYERILGYSLQELGTNPFAQIHPDDSEKVKKASVEAIRTGVGQSVEYRMRHKDGNWRTFESRASTILDERGEVERLVIVNRDITERKHLEEQFRQAQKMEAVGRLSGGVAHDFNNLLGVIIGYAEIVQERMAATDPLRGRVDEILKASHRAASLTRQLLAFSRQQVLDPKILDLNAVVKDMEKMLQRLIGEDIELKTELHPALARIKADEGQIEQVVLNLAVNARDVMPHGGKLVLATSNFHMDQDFVRRYPYPVPVGDYVLFAVSDTGIGMDAAIKARIFEPFFTTKEKGKGTGLGLSTVYGVVKQSGGYIEVASELNAGTVFKIYLPKVEGAVVEQPRTEMSASLRGAETVLLVEDEPSLRILARHQLESCGYSVLEAGSGADALEVARKELVTIHLLLTDVVMPGINGRILAEELLRRRPLLSVVYMSGYTGQAMGEDGVLDAGSHFLPKPFTREALARKLREALEGKSAAGAAAQ